ncbi:nucleotidyltransferase family protein [Bacillus sp. EB600]|uniref:nucleotidyltransferase domain-containing protein n=1 Tax=Bacillus sp. EB600 TaxID=2806345 RepID=UPI00210939C7|nr:nucleotidyltransferase family protein [Bacillus sp. EB600]MCQ6278908.1 nucleotidyltransferase family protein [Bacillus sp. EB600]
MAANFKLDVSNFSRELSLLLELIKLDEAGNTHLIKKEAFTDIEWDQFLLLAKHHRVYPIIYKNLKKVPEDWFPLYVGSELSRLYQNNTIQMLHLTGEMEQVNKVFFENGVRVLFLKGPVLGTALYGDVSLRTSSDLDVLIPMNKLKKAEEVLLEKGYIKDDYIQSILHDWKWRHHHITFFHPEKRIKLEIHWRMNPGPAKEPKFNELWGRKIARTSSLTSYPTYYLGYEDLFLFLVTHGARHGWSRIRWLVDIVKMTKKDIKWEELIKLLRKYHYLHLGGQSLILSAQLLNVKVEKEMNDLVEGKRPKQLAQDALYYIRQIVNLHTEPVPQEIADYHKRHLFKLMSIRQKLLFSLSFLYPFAIDADTLPLPKVLHILYFPLRPMLMLWRKTKNRAIPRRAQN